MTWIELRKPLPIPYKPIHVAWTDGDTFEFQPRNAKRMCLPADYANYYLYKWNQLKALTLGNPWYKTYDWRDASSRPLTKLVLREGTNIRFFGAGYQGPWGEPTAGYPMNFTLDKTAHKYSFEFYLDNDLEETSPSVIYDDDEAFWSPHRGGTGSYDISISEELTEVKKGTSSLKINIGTGTYAHLGVYHDYVAADWSDKDFLCLYIYGVNSGLTIWVQITTPDIANSGRFDLIDNFTGWKRFVLPLKKPDVINGTYDLTNVNVFRIQYRSVNQTFTSYLDRTVVDVGQWVKVETYVPDVLLNSGSGIKIYSWDGSAWAAPYWFAWNPYKAVGYSSYSGAGYLLDGSRVYDIYDAFHWTGFIVGERGETKGYIHSSAAGKITYSSYYGCKKRIGFAIRMPPDDGQDSSTYGISQCKLKLEVSYDKETYAGVDRYGAATYEFEDSANQYYGLRNINESWIALFPESGASKGAEMLFLSARPTGLEISADEDGVIYKVKLTLPKGTAVYAGSLLHGDVTLDSDGDGVPDCLEMLSYQLTGQ